MLKEKLPKQRKSKLDLRSDGLFQVLEHVNDNTYEIDLLGEYDVSAVFNISNLLPFDLSKDSMTNHFE